MLFLSKLDIYFSSLFCLSKLLLLQILLDLWIALKFHNITSLVDRLIILMIINSLKVSFNFSLCCLLSLREVVQSGPVNPFLHIQV